MTDRIETIISTLETLRRRVCAYDHPGFEVPPPTCDCKFSNIGTHGKPLGMSEQTGCPELREAIDALRVIQAIGNAGFLIIHRQGLVQGDEN